jgi:hypothetical protein
LIRQALGVLGWSLADLWENILVLAVCNLFWALALLPGLFVAIFIPGYLYTLLGAIGFFLTFIVAVVLLVLLGGPATIGIFYLTADTSRRERLEVAEFWQGVRRFYRRGWLLGAINAFLGIVASFDLFFYGRPDFSNSPIGLLYIVWIYLLISWFVFQLYLWPLAMRMESNGKLPLKMLFRNAGLAMFKYIGLSLIIGLVTLLLLALEMLLVLVPLIFFGMSLYGLISNRTVKSVLIMESVRSGLSENKASIEVPTDIEKTEKEKAEKEKLERERAENPPTMADPANKLPPGVTQRGAGVTKK